jgi:hypothetical protein
MAHTISLYMAVSVLLSLVCCLFVNVAKPSSHMSFSANPADITRNWRLCLTVALIREGIVCIVGKDEFQHFTELTTPYWQEILQV